MALQILWFILWGLLWAVYFMLDGFDFGVSMLRPFLARDEGERRVALHAIGPTWNGNEVWLITAGGATFAAFPAVYASMFSFLYLPMFLILLSLILRGVAIEFREKVENPRWHGVWDWILAVSSFTAPLVLGLGFGNIFRGLAFDSTGYHGTFWRLFNPYGLLTALLFIVLFLQHGAVWLGLKSTGELKERSRRFATVIWWIVLVVAAGFLVATAFATRLLGNFLAGPWWFLVPLIAVLALVDLRMFVSRGLMLPAFVASSVTIVLVIATGLIGMYPHLIPSRLDPAAGLTIFNASSGQYTLRVMTIVALIFVPIVVVYQFLVYRFFRKAMTKEEASEAEGY
jgi:cytochrome bd ubiquinol oxidase subunit II